MKVDNEVREWIECLLEKWRMLEVSSVELDKGITHILQMAEQPDTEVEGKGWQSIENAPKDNKYPLLLALFNEDGVLINFGFNGGWDREKESWGISEHYYYWPSAYGLVETPTHWMYQPEWFDNLSTQECMEMSNNKPLDDIEEDHYPVAIVFIISIKDTTEVFEVYGTEKDVDEELKKHMNDVQKVSDIVVFRPHEAYTLEKRFHKTTLKGKDK